MSGIRKGCQYFCQYGVRLSAYKNMALPQPKGKQLEVLDLKPEAGLIIAKNKIWYFDRNYRNSKEIAQFAVAISKSKYFEDKVNKYGITRGAGYYGGKHQ